MMIIGSDGASPELIYEWASRGMLPSLKELMTKGARGRLMSTVPAHSGPAWVSAITGKNPGKHGVFYFTTVNPRRTPMRIVSSRDIRTETLFDVLSSYGKRSIVVNVPITYPPWKISGILVSGMFTPSERVVFTSPPEIGPELVKKGYEVEFSTRKDFNENKRMLSRDEPQDELARMRSAYAKRTLEIDNKNSDAFLGLVQSKEWDLSMVVLPGLDRIQHMLWQPLVPGEEHPAGNQFGCSKYVVEAYQNVDRLVKRFLSATDPETWVIFLSDHGFGPTPRVFFVNRWLRNVGLLTPSTTRGKSAGLAYKRGVRRLKNLFAGPDRTRAHHVLLEFSPLSDIDMARTKAYAVVPYGLISINAGSDAERDRLASSLVKQIEDLVDPTSGRRVIRKAHTSSQLYSGPYQDEAPDLILEPDPDYYIDNRVKGEDVFANAKRSPAMHKPQGILLLCGPQAKAGLELQNAHIYDITSTVLRILGVPLSENLDGRTLDEAFQPDSPLMTSKVTRAETQGEIGKRENTDETNDETVQMERLRTLGYL
jgi:predicted AlkP superfamily phosphohydrolase/phosphomutase